MTTPGKEHWTNTKRMFRYLCGMPYFSICDHGNFEDVGVHGFVDSDWVGDTNRRKSINGYVFRFFGGAISWMRRKQSMVSLSTTEVEYIIAIHAIKEVV